MSEQPTSSDRRQARDLGEGRLDATSPRLTKWATDKTPEKRGGCIGSATASDSFRRQARNVEHDEDHRKDSAGKSDRKGAPEDTAASKALQRYSHPYRPSPLGPGKPPSAGYESQSLAESSAMASYPDPAKTPRHDFHAGAGSGSTDYPEGFNPGRAMGRLEMLTTILQDELTRLRIEDRKKQETIHEMETRMHRAEHEAGEARKATKKYRQERDRLRRQLRAIPNSILPVARQIDHMGITESSQNFADIASRGSPDLLLPSGESSGPVWVNHDPLSQRLERMFSQIEVWAHTHATRPTPRQASRPAVWKLLEYCEKNFGSANAHTMIKNTTLQPFVVAAIIGQEMKSLLFSRNGTFRSTFDIDIKDLDREISALFTDYPADEPWKFQQMHRIYQRRADLYSWMQKETGFEEWKARQIAFLLGHLHLLLEVLVPPHKSTTAYVDLQTIIADAFEISQEMMRRPMRWQDHPAPLGSSIRSRDLWFRKIRLDEESSTDANSSTPLKVRLNILPGIIATSYQDGKCFSSWYTLKTVVATPERRMIEQ